MSSYKDILCKNLRKAIDEEENARAYRHQYHLYDNPAVPVECFVCKQSFLEIYNFRYSICPDNYENVFIRWNIQREPVCRVCLNSRMAEEEYQKQLEEYEAAELANMVACIECGEKVDPSDILISRSNYKLLPVCMAKCYKKVYPCGIEPMNYDLLFGKYDNSRGMDDSHLAEDEIYRRFICDVATGRFESQEKMMDMAKKIKKLIDERANCGRWYA
jgi:hypothetical protein